MLTADLGAQFEGAVDESALVRQEVHDLAEVVHRLVGDNHQFPGGTVEEVVGLQAPFVDQRERFILRGAQEDQAVDGGTLDHFPPPAFRLRRGHEVLHADRADTRM